MTRTRYGSLAAGGLNWIACRSSCLWWQREVLGPADIDF
ncbi:hypothetical protein I552_0357, partial [Mycobacterium xenopi 3993]